MIHDDVYYGPEGKPKISAAKTCDASEAGMNAAQGIRDYLNLPRDQVSGIDDEPMAKIMDAEFGTALAPHFRTLEAILRVFVRRCEAGEVRSRRTYTAAKAALDRYDADRAARIAAAT